MQSRPALTSEPDIRAREITSHDVARSAGTTLLARLGAIIEVIAQPIYVWLFGLASYGIYTALWAAVTLVETVADLGMTSALQRTVPQAKSEREAVAALRAALILGVTPPLILALLASLGAPLIAHAFNAADADAAKLVDFIQLFAWSLPLWAFIEVSTSALRARRVFGAEIRLRLFWEQVVRLIVASGFWLAGFGTLSLFYGHLVSLLVICALCIQLLRRHFDLSLLRSGPSAEPVWRKSWLAGISVMPANLVARFFSDAPTLALNALLPGAAGAIAGAQFALARKISSIVQTIRLTFTYVLSPLASAALSDGNEVVGRIYSYATRISLVVALPVCCVLIGGSATLLKTIGGGMETAVWALAVLLLARLAEAVTGTAAPIQQVLSRYSSQYIGSVMGVFLSTLLAAFLLPEGGLMGMTLAVALGLVVTAAIPVVQLHRQDGLQPYDAPFGRVFARAMAVGLACLILGFGLNYLPLAIGVALLLPLALAGLWASCRFALPLEDRTSLGRVAEVLRLV